MALPDWPSDVPSCPMLGTMQVQQATQAPLRTEMNAGTTRARRKYSLRIARLSMSLRMTNAQVVAFREFHEETLGDGSLRFNVPLVFAGVRRTEVAQFVDPPSFESLGSGATKVSFSLLVENLGSGAVYVPPDEPDPEYVPSFDFSDPRNSGYLVLLDIAVPAGSFTPSFDFSEPLNSGYLVLLGDY